MNKYEVTGWNAANPLHMLASLGVFVLTDDAEPGTTRLSFRQGSGTWIPVISSRLDEAGWTANIVNRIVAAGAVAAADVSTKAASNAVNKAKARLKRAAEALKQREKELKAQAKANKVPKAELRAFLAEKCEPERSELDAAQLEADERQGDLADGLGDGMAHLGDLVGVEVSVFRSKAERCLVSGNRALIRQMSALASDGCVDGARVKATPFSFGNGASGQFLLKDFRTLSMLVNASMVNLCMLGRTERTKATSLNWDPSGQKSYALQWDDPASEGKQIDVLANAAAYLGLGLLTAVPTMKELGAVGFHRPNWTWPVWEFPMNEPSVRSILAHEDLVKPSGADRMRMRGAAEVFRSERINVNKRFFFAPSRAV